MQIITRKLSLVIALISLTVYSFPIVSNAEIIVINATEDSGMLDGDDRNDPFPGILYSELDTATAGNIWLSILKFDLSSIVGMEISSATFELTSIINHNTSVFTHDVFSSGDDSWTEGLVTGVNRPLDSTLTLLDSTGIGGSSQTYSWNVIDGVLGADGLTGTNNFLTLLVRPELSQAGNAFGPHFNDRESTSEFPRLLINANPVSPEGDDCVATYKTDGSLNIPCVSVTDGLGDTINYQAKMKLIPLSDPFVFELTEVQQKDRLSIDNICIATYLMEGALNIPCVSVPDPFAGTVMYQADMQLIPLSSPFAFELIEAREKPNS